MSQTRIKSIFIILYLLGLALLLGMAIWQYQRGMEKRAISALRDAEPLNALMAKPDDWSPYYFRDTYLRGQWVLGRDILLENKIYQGRLGFEVISPFLLDDQSTTILVNRGWAESAATLNKSLDGASKNLSGVIYHPQRGVELGESVLPAALNSNTWPKAALYLDISVFGSMLKRRLEPVVLVLEDNAPDAYQRIWKALVMTDTKHFGYAVQWLGLALTLIIYGIIWLRRKS